MRKLHLLIATFAAALAFVAAPASAQTRSVWIDDLTWVEVRDAITAGKTTAIIFVGSSEQNGPHMAVGKHNFIANGIATHNSIEQDADVVILLHRDDYYDKESPRAGEADFIVAKHRNGPTDTVTVAAQLHLSRFVDMAIV